jgi:glycyl-tRNA synthetase beta chain
LVLADQLDKLAGYLGLGLVPSGSSDPFGLRRAAGIAMETALKWEAPIDLDHLLAFAAEGYARPLDAVAVVASAREVFRQRCEVLFPGTPPDILEAVLAVESVVFRPRELASRLERMTELAKDVPFVQTATRPLNIVAAAEKKGIFAVPLERAHLQSAEGEALLAALEGPAQSDLKALQGPIDAFFDSTMVMTDDTAVRDARLALLRGVCDLLLTVGDFSKLVIPG